MTQPASQIRTRHSPERGPAGAGRAPLGAALPLPKLIAALVFAGCAALLQAYWPLPPWALFAFVFLLSTAMSLGFRARPPREASASVQAFGPYTLVRKLGEGGMGVVYEARHALLCRPTALKLLRKEVDDPALMREALLRFEREVQLTSQLAHPNTIAIYDYGQSEDGAFYYAMEYIDGIDLERLVRVDGPLAPAHVIHLALQICGALAEAHARSLIHRDIKPNNILVYERAGVTDAVKVLDFGLVKSLHGPAVSGAHVLVGTPLYTAPEVFVDPSRASPRSDIYALGAVLYWLATGKTLQEAALLRMPMPEGMPVDLERLIVRCTESEPSERPESMEAVAAELAQCRDYGKWTVAHSRSYWEERGKRLSRLLATPAAPDANTLAAS